MKVFFDHQMFSHQRIGGVSKYFAELLRCFPRDIWSTSTWLSNNQYVKDYNLFPVRSFFPNCNFKGKGRLMLELGIPYTLYRLRKHDYDVYHQTHYEKFSLWGIGNKPMVTTFHDLNFFNVNKNERLMHDSVLSIERADKIIAISQNTKEGLVNNLGVDESKIVVIYHGIDKIDLSALDKRRIFPFPYVLYVGSRNQKFKNFATFARAFAILNQKYKDIHMVCTGIDFSKEEMSLFADLGISDRCHTYYAREEEMLKLYHEAELFVYPSKSEGFGMPILEAMQCGCPCVLAEASCFPEIAQSSALYFKPDSVEDLYSQMELLINSPSVKIEIVNKGMNRVSDFSWDKTAQEHISVYKSLL